MKKRAVTSNAGARRVEANRDGVTRPGNESSYRTPSSWNIEWRRSAAWPHRWFDDAIARGLRPGDDSCMRESVPLRTISGQTAAHRSTLSLGRAVVVGVELPLGRVVDIRTSPFVFHRVLLQARKADPPVEPGIKASIVGSRRPAPFGRRSGCFLGARYLLLAFGAFTVFRRRPLGEVARLGTFGLVIRARGQCAVSCRFSRLCGVPEFISQPAGQWVRTGENLVHHFQVVDSKPLKIANLTP